MDRPEALNAFNPQMMHELCNAFLKAAEDEKVKVVILTGSGRAFTAGADLKSMSGSRPETGPPIAQNYFQESGKCMGQSLADHSRACA